MKNLAQNLPEQLFTPLQTAKNQPPAINDQRRLLPLVKSRAAATALLQLGITTVGQFLATPYERVSGTRGLRLRTWQKIADTITAGSHNRSVAGDLLPDSLRGMLLQQLQLPPELLMLLESLGCKSFGQAMGLAASTWKSGGQLGPFAAEELRTALDKTLAPVLHGDTAAQITSELDWSTICGRLLGPLDEDERDLFCKRTGFRTAIRSSREQAQSSGHSLTEVLLQEVKIRSQLKLRAPSMLAKLASEARQELSRHVGVLRNDRLAAGSSLHTIAEASGDRELPVRLLAFLFPEEFYDHGGCLSALPVSARLQFMRELRAMTAPRLLPRPITEIEASLKRLVADVPRGLLLHLLADRFRLHLHRDELRGEMVLPQQPEIAARIREMLTDSGRPAQLADLLLDYRERFHVASRQRIQSHLRRDPSFLEIGPDIWSLRGWHVDELAAAKPLAESVINTICERGGRHAVSKMVEGDSRLCFVVLDLVRSDPRIRNLGRGEVCSAGQKHSHLLAQLLHSFGQAQGEVVYSRFIANQTQDNRRLVERLLHENRMFVFPDADRIDLLSNFPFHAHRLERLLTVVDNYLKEHDGHALLSEVLVEVNRCDLGGSWLNPKLLGEILRRHGDHEVLPGDFIARGELALGSWLLRRARNALRAANLPITVGEILAERPELAKYRSCLQLLLQRDPLVQTPDGMHFQIA